MNTLSRLWAKMTRSVELTPVQADQLARIKFPCC